MDYQTTKTEITIKGLLDNATFNAVSGVFTIPNSKYGDKIIPARNNIGGKYSNGEPFSDGSGIRGVFSYGAEFYDDTYNSNLVSGTEYGIDNYVVSKDGTIVTLTDSTVSGAVQVYYTYDGAESFLDNELFKTDPRVTECVSLSTYKIKCLIEAELNFVDLLNKLAVALEDTTYSDKAEALLDEIVTKQADHVSTDDEYDSGAVSLYSRTYDQLGATEWESLSYSGLQNPFVFKDSDSFSSVLTFLLDAQNKYYDEFGDLGAFYPALVRDVIGDDDAMWGNPGYWSYEGHDPACSWAGLQYKVFASLCETYYSLYKQEVQSWNEGTWKLDFEPGAYRGTNEYEQLKAMSSNFTAMLNSKIIFGKKLPTAFRSDGSVKYDYDDISFYAVVGRGCAYKYMTDGDLNAKTIMHFCFNKVIATQQANGSFASQGELTYLRVQGEVLRFLGALKSAYVANESTYKDAKAFWKSAWVHFGEPTKNKSIERIVIHYPEEVNEDFNFSYAKNFVSGNIRRPRNFVTLNKPTSQLKEMYLTGPQQVKAIQLIIEADENQFFRIEGFELQEVEVDD